MDLMDMFIYPSLPKVKADGIRVACVGDSITQGSDPSPDYPDGDTYPVQLQELLGENYQTLNYGLGGRTLLKSGDFPYWDTSYFRASHKIKPAIVLIMLGTNDTKPQNWDAAAFERQLIDFVQSYKILACRPAVYLLSPPAAFVAIGAQEVIGAINKDIIANEVAPIVKWVALQTDTTLIDVFDSTKNHPEYFADGVHPNTDGNKAIAATIYSVLPKMT